MTTFLPIAVSQAPTYRLHGEEVSRRGGGSLGAVSQAPPKASADAAWRRFGRLTALGFLN